MWLKKIGWLTICVCCAVQLHAQIVAGRPLPAWQNGLLDIHHINTGRGSSAFCVLPDGTTMLIDAGELTPLDPRTFSARTSAAKPDSSRKPYEWLASYIMQVAPDFNKAIDYAVISHFHDDHFGAWYPWAPWSAEKKYRLTGITGVGELIPVKYLMDRGYPDYNYPYSYNTPLKALAGGELAYDSTMKNYFNFIEAQKQKGLQQLPFKAGVNNQIVLQHSKGYKDFYVRQIKANQFIWTGKDTSVYNHFPEWVAGEISTYPSENSLSLAMSIHYGAFSYYTGGDIPGNIYPGDRPTVDVATPVSQAAGPVEVAVLDHHGNRDAVNVNMIRNMQPAVWIGQSWSSDHPGDEVLRRIMNPHISPVKPVLFATNMLEANKLVIGPLIDRAYLSQQGHIVIRVQPGGKQYNIIILDDETETRAVKEVYYRQTK